MLPVKQVGPSVAVTAGAWSQASTNGSMMLVTAPSTNTAVGYFEQSPTNSAAPSGSTGVPINPGQSLVIEQANATAYWGSVGANLIVTPVEIPRVF